MDVDLLGRIRQERRRRGWSMRAAASAAGVSNTTWSRMEAGAVEITPHMSQAIAQAFGWPAEWESLPNLAGTLSHPMTTVDADELLERIRAELAEHRRQVQAMFDEMKEAGNDDGRQQPGNPVEHELHQVGDDAGAGGTATP